MPGHIKKSEGPDPDPSPWLIVSDELKVKLKAKPYDPKKSCWVPEKGTGGYLEGLIDSADGDKVTVKLLVGGEVSKKLCEMNVDDENDIFPLNAVQSLQEGPGWPSQPS